MVDILTPRVAPSARAAGQVSTGQAQSLTRAGQVAQGVADKFSAYYDEKAAIENDLILATAQSDWTQTFNERSKGAGNGFTKGIMGEYDAYIATVMETAPQRGRDRLVHSFDKYRISLEDKAMAREAAARAAAIAAQKVETINQNDIAILHDQTLYQQHYDAAIEADDINLAKHYTDLYNNIRLASDDPEIILSLKKDIESGKFDKLGYTANGLLALQTKAEDAATKAETAIREVVDEARDERANILLTRPELLDDIIDADPVNEDYYSRWAVTGRATTDPEGVIAELKSGEWDDNLTPDQKNNLQIKAQSVIDKRETEGREETRRANAAQEKEDKAEEDALKKKQELRFFRFQRAAISAAGLDVATVNAAVESGDITAGMGRALLGSTLETAAIVTDLSLYNEILDMQERGEDTAAMILENIANLTPDDARALLHRNSTEESETLEDAQKDKFFTLAMAAVSPEGLDVDTINAAVEADEITSDMGRALIKSLPEDAAIVTDRVLYDQVIKAQDAGSDTTDIILSNRTSLTATDALFLIRRSSEKLAPLDKMSSDAKFYRDEVRAAVAPSGMLQVLDQGSRDRRYNAMDEYTKRIKEGETPHVVARDIIKRARAATVADYNKQLHGLLLPRFSVVTDGTGGKREIDVDESTLLLDEKYTAGLISSDSFARQNALINEWAKIQTALKAAAAAAAATAAATGSE